MRCATRATLADVEVVIRGIGDLIAHVGDLKDEFRDLVREVRELMYDVDDLANGVADAAHGVGDPIVEVAKPTRDVADLAQGVADAAKGAVARCRAPFSHRLRSGVGSPALVGRNKRSALRQSKHWRPTSRCRRTKRYGRTLHSLPGWMSAPRPSVIAPYEIYDPLQSVGSTPRAT